ncbi:MAG: hypothetical protein R3F59_14470 [Myxococcota bacterium]
MSNLPALTSMLAGLATVALMLASFCAGTLPVIGGQLALALLALQVLTAGAAFGLGLVGYRLAGRRGGAGTGGAMGGLGIAVTWGVLQAVGWGAFGVVQGLRWLL